MKNINTEGAILLIGIGNSGRGDDGLGWRFVDSIDALGYHFIDYEFRYQLQVEDAALISHYDVVIFADASREKHENGFHVCACEAVKTIPFTTHAQSPEAILELTRELYDTCPKAYMIGITGERWEFQNALSATAEKNLQRAVDYFSEQLAPICAEETIINW